MLVTRCEWHRQYFGYASYTDIKRDHRWRVAVSGGICPACAAVLRGRGKSVRTASVGKEIGRVAVALTALAAWALVVLLAGCEPATGPTAEREPFRVPGGAWQVEVRIFTDQLCGAERPGAAMLRFGNVHAFGDPAQFDKIDAECREGRYKPPAPLRSIGAPVHPTSTAQPR